MEVIIKTVLIKIVICDDIKTELEIISTAMDAYKAAHPGLCFEVDRHSAAMDLLDAVESGRSYDIALMDICMPGVLGTDVAKEMLSRNPDMGIVFLTTSDEYAVTAFAMNAVHYLLKPFTQEQFDAALDRAVQKTKGRDFLFLACVDGMYRVPVNEIVSVESQSHYLLVHLSSGEMLRLRGKLSQMYEEMQRFSEFIRVGASYIINLSFVRKISSNTIEMQNGTRIPIPRRRSDEVRKAYMDFFRKEALQ